MKLELGTICYDAHGQPWCYIGYRTTSVDSRDHHFAKCYVGGDRSISGPTWIYHASREATILRKFPSLAQAEVSERPRS